MSLNTIYREHLPWRTSTTAMALLCDTLDIEDRCTIIRALGERWDAILRSLEDNPGTRTYGHVSEVVLVNMVRPYCHRDHDNDDVLAGMVALRDRLSALSRWECFGELSDNDDYLLTADADTVLTHLCRDVDEAVWQLVHGVDRPCWQCRNSGRNPAVWGRTKTCPEHGGAL